MNDIRFENVYVDNVLKLIGIYKNEIYVSDDPSCEWIHIKLIVSDATFVNDMIVITHKNEVVAILRKKELETCLEKKELEIKAKL